MREIGLTQGQVALVDDADYEELSKYKWYSLKNCWGDFYAVRKSPIQEGKRFTIYMHRQLLGLDYRDKREGDHQNHNTLDNRQDNLRVCTHFQNMRNQKLSLNQSSKFKGVTWDKCVKKWQASIYVNGKSKNLGRFLMEEIAALAYDMVAIREFGEFACLNF